MKVKFNIQVSGPSTSFEVGKTYDLPPEEVLRFVKGNIADPVDVVEYQTLLSRDEAQQQIVTLKQSHDQLAAIAVEKRTLANEHAVAADDVEWQLKQQADKLSLLQQSFAAHGEGTAAADKAAADKAAADKAAAEKAAAEKLKQSGAQK